MLEQVPKRSEEFDKMLDRHDMRKSQHEYKQIGTRHYKLISRYNAQYSSLIKVSNTWILCYRICQPYSK